MPIQLCLRFDEVPITCSVQERYHAIAPCLGGKVSQAQRARDLDLSYRTITRWLQQFREKGMPGLFDATSYPREPYTPERIVVILLYYKCLCSLGVGPRTGAGDEFHDGPSTA